MLLIGILCFTLFGFSPELVQGASAPIVQADYKVMNQRATVTYQVHSKYKITNVKYLRGYYRNTNHTNWTKKAKDITGKSSFTVKQAGDYSILATNSKGTKTIYNFKVTLEFRAAWIAYYDFSSSKGMNQTEFTNYINHMFDQVVAKNMNAVVVHVRPFSDAMYPSKYFPWSVYASGAQGVSPGYDPLAIMVDAAHKKGLEFHAWLNPYRISSASADVNTLSSNHPARKWRQDGNTKTSRNVLEFSGKLYYNPATTEVQNLIVNGIKEIVSNYDVDGIHFDDYFYPDLYVSDYTKNFDAPEYELYKNKQVAAKKSYMSIANWRRNNVNKLLKKIYSSIKAIDNTVEFGVSPGGYLDYLTMDDRNYVDFPTWMSKEGYLDYICPQIYWSFDEWNKFPFTNTVNRWLEYRTSSHVKVYLGIGVYKLGITTEPGWDDPDILKNMILTGRTTKKIDGYLFFDYADLIQPANQTAIQNLVSVLN